MLSEVDNLASGSLMRGSSDITGHIIERKLTHILFLIIGLT
jgi:hypothetical protein